MADLEATLADISFIIVSNEPCITRKIVLPDPSVRYVTETYLQEQSLLSFDQLFNDRFGYVIFKQFLAKGGTGVLGTADAMEFLEMIEDYKTMDSTSARKPVAKAIYNKFIMPDLLAMEHPYDMDKARYVRSCLRNDETDSDLFDNYKIAIKAVLKEEEYQTFLLSHYYTRYLQWKYIEINTQIKKDDFIEHRIIGRGGFGEVYGCRKVDTGRMYAIKYLYKKRLKLKNGIQMAFNERDMLAMIDSRFIVCLNYAFQTEDRLCFVLDLMNGGDLHYHLRQRKLFTEEETQFYAAEVTLGLEHMHSRSIVYRDLKPANILLDEAGHVKISDLGLAQDFSRKKPTSTVGTHGYMAPEVLERGKAYDSTSDWFSLGCTLYKLLTGRCPYHATKDTPSPAPKVELPDTFSSNLLSLLHGLLEYTPESRLGYHGTSEIKSHPFFCEIDWTTAAKGNLVPPFIPSKGEVHAADVFDIGTFNEDDTKGIKITKEDQETFRSFYLFMPDRWQREILGQNPTAGRVRGEDGDQNPTGWDGDRDPSTCFNVANTEADKTEGKKGQVHRTGSWDCVMQGYMLKLGGPILTQWQRRYFHLFPNRLEWRNESSSRIASNLVTMDDILSIRLCNYKTHSNCICLDVSKTNNTKDMYLLRTESTLEFEQWNKRLTATLDAARLMIKRGCKKLQCVADTIIEGDWSVVDTLPEGDWASSAELERTDW